MRALPAARPSPPRCFAALALAGCDTAEERAEAHYQRALALLAAGDADRAMVEFRNVFRLDGEQRAARLAYAGAAARRGEIREANGQYLRLVEQDPRNLEGHRALIALALQMQDFATAEEHVAAAYASRPTTPRIRALKADRGLPRPRAPAPRRWRWRARWSPRTPASSPAQMVLIADRLNAGAPKPRRSR